VIHFHVDNSLPVLSEEEVYNRASENRADIKALSIQPEMNDQQTKIACISYETHRFL
jgi:hypothetical protein